jgi:hypothetical protein
VNFNGRTITYNKMEQHIMVNFREIKDVVEEHKYGQMDQFMKGIKLIYLVHGLKIKQMDMVD